MKSDANGGIGVLTAPPSRAGHPVVCWHTNGGRIQRVLQLWTGESSREPAARSSLQSEIMSGCHNQGEQDRYSAELSASNQTCLDLNFTRANLMSCPDGNTKNYHCQRGKVMLSENLGYSAPGHCIQGVTLNPQTGIQIDTGWYDPIFCECLALIASNYFCQR